jgi:hypothetical protein
MNGFAQINGRCFFGRNNGRSTPSHSIGIGNERPVHAPRLDKPRI